MTSLLLGEVSFGCKCCCEKAEFECPACKLKLWCCEDCFTKDIHTESCWSYHNTRPKDFLNLATYMMNKLMEGDKTPLKQFVFKDENVTIVELKRTEKAGFLSDIRLVKLTREAFRTLFINKIHGVKEAMNHEYKHIILFTFDSYNCVTVVKHMKT